MEFCVFFIIIDGDLVEKIDVFENDGYNNGWENGYSSVGNNFEDVNDMSEVVYISNYKKKGVKWSRNGFI